MTPRRAGWLSGILVCAVIACTHGVVAIVRARTTEAGALAIGPGEYLLSLAVSAVPLGIASGLLVAAIVASGRGQRAAIIAAVASFGLVGLWVWWGSVNSPRAPGEDRAKYALELIDMFVTTGTVLALAAAVLTWWIVRTAVGRDGAERALALETADLQGARGSWGTAMRAELASIDDPAERGRFSRSAGMLALRRGTGRWPVLLAGLTGVGAAVLVFAAARVSFDRPRARGIIGEPLMGLVGLLLVVAVIAGVLIGRSFRAGLETAVLAWIAVYLATIAVEIPQALAWYDDSRIFLLDGDPASGVDALAAALQPLTHGAFITIAVAQLVLAVLAAALGVLVLGAVRRVGLLRTLRSEAG